MLHQDLDIVMSMYNLLEYSQNYSMTSRSLWNYYRDEINNVNDNASDYKLCKYKTKIEGKTPWTLAQLPQTSQNPDATQPPRPYQF